MIKDMIKSTTFFSIFISVVLLATAAYSAEELVLVKDINTNSRPLEVSHVCEGNGFKIYFANDGVRGGEIWSGDGITTPAVLIKDINPGSATSLVRGNSCLKLNQYVYFSAYEPTTGDELWRTDGTASGTQLVKDLVPGTEGSSIGFLQATASKIYFSARDATNGEELWQSDGTASGTALVQDINPGNSSSNLTESILLGTKLIFNCDNGVLGNELCILDTVGNTLQIVDIDTGGGSSYPSEPIELNSKVYFTAYSSATGKEIYQTDGTPAGTAILTDLNSGAGDGIPSTPQFKLLSSKIFFVGNTPATGFELYITDGTSSGTVLLKDINPGVISSDPASFSVSDNKLVFTASTVTDGREVWISDGTPSGTVLRANIDGAPTDSMSSSDPLLTLGTKAFAPATTVTEGTEVFTVDLNSGATDKLSNFIPGKLEATSYAFNPGLANNVYIYSPSSYSSLPSGVIYLSDGTVGGTRLHPGSFSSFNSSSTPLPLGTISGKVIFAANDGSSGYELWSTDGTAAGTSRIVDLNVGSNWSVLPQHGGAVVTTMTGTYLFFIGVDAAHGAELWRTDGTPAGTVVVADIVPGPDSAFEFYGPSNPTTLVATTNKVIIVAETPAQGKELWVSDGVTTNIISDLNPGPASSIGTDFYGIYVPGAEQLYFSADDGSGTRGEELYYSNGSFILLATDINPGAAGSSPRDFKLSSLATGLFFSAETVANGREPYFDNTAMTTFLGDLNPGASGSNPTEFEDLTDGVNTYYYVSANLPATGKELYRINSATLIASLVADIIPGADGSEPRYLNKLDNDTATFTACSTTSPLVSVDNCELWKVEAGGTATLLKDVNQTSSTSSYPFFIGKLGSNSYYSAYEESNQRYVYLKSDGTIAGTTTLTFQGATDFNGGLYTRRAFPALSTLFIPAYSTIYGTELFKISEDQCATDPNKTFAGICGCGVADADTDGDGLVDCNDVCPTDGTKSVPGTCGCGVAETDSDGDGTPNCNDQCSSDPSKIVPGTCGCGIADSDLNSNGTIDCVDAQLSSLTPRKARLRKTSGSRPKIKAAVETKVGATYVVQSRTILPGRRARTFRTKVFTDSNRILFKFPSTVGSRLQVKYRIRMTLPGRGEVLSNESSLATYRRR